MAMMPANVPWEFANLNADFSPSRAEPKPKAEADCKGCGAPLKLADGACQYCKRMSLKDLE